jgi:hypothetical protein
MGQALTRRALGSRQAKRRPYEGGQVMRYRPNSALTAMHAEIMARLKRAFRTAEIIQFTALNLFDELLPAAGGKGQGLAIRSSGGTDRD